jgi:hypothetical protein
VSVGDKRPVTVQKDCSVGEKGLLDETADSMREDKMPGLDGRRVERG